MPTQPVRIFEKSGRAPCQWAPPSLDSTDRDEPPPRRATCRFRLRLQPFVVRFCALHATATSTVSRHGAETGWVGSKTGTRCDDSDPARRWIEAVARGPPQQNAVEDIVILGRGRQPVPTKHEFSGDHGSDARGARPSCLSGRPAVGPPSRSGWHFARPGPPLAKRDDFPRTCLLGSTSVRE